MMSRGSKMPRFDPQPATVSYSGPSTVTHSPLYGPVRSTKLVDALRAGHRAAVEAGVGDALGEERVPDLRVDLAPPQGAAP